LTQGNSLRSLESFEPLGNYDVIAFSICYENNVPNLVRILQLGHIPIWSKSRTNHHPFVLAGGVVSTINPEPFAEFMDACVLGEGEDIIPEIVEIFISTWKTNKDRILIKNSLAQIPGVYIPSFYKPFYGINGEFQGINYIGEVKKPKLQRRLVEELDSHPGSTVIHSPESKFPDLHLIEITRGCMRGCKFCLIPNCYGKFRFRSIRSILDEAALAPPGYRIGLLGAGAADHPHLLSICNQLVGLGKNFSFSSLNAADLTPEFLELINKFGPRTLTLAPETGSDQRRKKLGKVLTQSDLIRAISLAGKPPIKNIKLYFMIGLPGESNTDVTEIFTLCQKLGHELRIANRDSSTIPRIMASVSCFVPKAQSPFERAPMVDEKTLKQRIQYLEKKFKTAREIRFTHDVPKWSIVQGFIARGDRRLSRALFQTGQKLENWRSILRKFPQNPGYILHRKRTLSEPMPWDHLKC